MFITGGLRLLAVVMGETPVLGVFNGVTDTLVEVGINGLGTMDGDGLGCVKGVRLLDTGGVRSLSMAVDEALGGVQAWPIQWVSLGVQNA